MNSLSLNNLVTSCQKGFGVLTGIFYLVFTLIPDSHSVMVLYPLVSLWQLGLLFPVCWLLSLLWEGKVSFLGSGFDWLIGLIIVSISLSTFNAQFPQQAIWYSWVVVCFVAAIYGLNSYLTTSKARYEILVKQGYVSFAFIVVSLFLWFNDTLLPELARINSVKQQGVALSFDFSVLELRNWAPIGHQNYVAGYLLLCLPLLTGLIIAESGKKRWFWACGLFLGLIALYTTSSRGGWLGLAGEIAVALIGLAFLSSFPRLWLLIGLISSFLGFALVILTNNRFSSLITGILQGKASGELAYRIINTVLGYRMGMSQPFTGVGVGNVPLLYQKYRPFWAGAESELVFQLHSTPIHLWAELGILAVILGLLGIALVILTTIKLFRYQDKLSVTDYTFAWCINLSFIGYGIMSLTDYQLDNVCISGILVIFTACLTKILSFEAKSLSFPLKQPVFSLFGLGIAIAFMVWLYPVHRAWQLSSQGFQALANNDLATFQQRLDKAHQIAPWEAYYTYQLGWNFGEIGLKTQDIAQKQTLIPQAIKYFQTAISTSPYQEFGHSNLAWLLLNTNPQAATQEFIASAELVPAKKGVFLGLGISLLAQNKAGLAIEAFSLELLREPALLTSPFWFSPQIKPLYQPIINNLQQTYTQWLQQEPNNMMWHQARGGIYWWLGDYAAAAQDWQQYGTELQKMMLSLPQETQLQSQLDNLPDSAAKSILKAWFNPPQRPQLITQAWLQLQSQTIPIPPIVLEQSVKTMTRSTNLETWLKKNAPVFPYHRQRMGFGVVSRHIDGTTPSDYYLVIENFAIANWLEELYPYQTYAPNLDFQLQPRRQALIDKLKR
jgi:uncharacterized protein involved in response to NO